MVESIQQNTFPQPRIIVVGNLNDPHVFFTVCNRKYTVNSICEAVKGCFHFYCSLNIKYPQEAYLLWRFVQKAIFNVTTEYDTFEPTLDSILIDFKV